MSAKLEAMLPALTSLLLITTLLSACETTKSTGNPLDIDQPGNKLVAGTGDPEPRTPTDPAPKPQPEKPFLLELCSQSVSNRPAQTVGLIVNVTAPLACRSGVQFMIVPSPGACMTSGYGNRLSSSGKLKFHKGFDYQGPEKTALPVVAAADGTVVINKFRDTDLGNWIVIDHGNNIFTGYGHLASKPKYAVGTSVKQGDELAMMGSTGPAAGNRIHLHVEFRQGELRHVASGGYFNLEHFNPFDNSANCPAS